MDSGIASRSNTALRLALLFLLQASSSRGLGPHEILLLVNQGSPSSIEVANHYARLRQIPPVNIVLLDPPMHDGVSEAGLSRDEFTRSIWDPARRAMEDRRIGDHILAWVYAPEFPLRVDGEPELSLTGLTFVRNQPPETEKILIGHPINSLFAGPGKPGGPRAPSRSIEQYAMVLGANMPVASMVLGPAGPLGETAEEMIRRLQNQTRADGAPLAGGVYFITNSDVRSTCREWQFPDTVAELRAIGQTAHIVGADSINPDSAAWGLMIGATWLNAARLPRVAPGGIGDHLTSFSAKFDTDDQTKCTFWLKQGAGGTAGPVTEPRAIWTKFPHARVFAHYAAGCTMLESFYQAVASPLQLAIFGDPLLSPWARPPGMALVKLSEQEEPLKGAVEFAASTWGGTADAGVDIIYLLDGRTVMPAGQPPVLRINTTRLQDGFHEVRAVAYAPGPIRFQSFAVRGFTVSNRGRAVRITNLTSNLVASSGTPLDVEVDVDQAPKEIAWLHRETLFSRQPVATNGHYRVDLAPWGAGPIDLQAAAIYEDGEIVRSRPIAITVQR